MEVNAQVSDAKDMDETCLIGKRPREEETCVFPDKMKGIVTQRNGYWSAEIYVNSHRIWLGMFGSEEEAATASDTAAIKIQSGEFQKNYSWIERITQEQECQIQSDEETLVKMVGTEESTPSKFSHFLEYETQCGKIQEGYASLTAMDGNKMGKFKQRRHLFHKVLTPSDVGKLNRLVIPIKYALKYFPTIQENQDCAEGGKQSDMQLVFYDKLMKSWNFRYCYWRSSQSFVFTRGWNRFVKEKKLQSKDIVVFYECENGEDETVDQKFSVIDICYHQDKNYGHMINYVDQDFKSLNQQNEERCIKKSKVASLRVEDNGSVKLFGVKIG